MCDLSIRFSPMACLVNSSVSGDWPASAVLCLEYQYVDAYDGTTSEVACEYFESNVGLDFALAWHRSRIRQGSMSVCAWSKVWAKSLVGPALLYSGGM